MTVGGGTGAVALDASFRLHPAVKKTRAATDALAKRERLRMWRLFMAKLPGDFCLLGTGHLQWLLYCPRLPAPHIDFRRDCRLVGRLLVLAKLTVLPPRDLGNYAKERLVGTIITGGQTD